MLTFFIVYYIIGLLVTAVAAGMAEDKTYSRGEWVIIWVFAPLFYPFLIAYNIGVECKKNNGDAGDV